MSGPLAGVRVVEVAHFISGPYAGMMLGDMGAEVIKVESPGSGDPFRKWGGFRGGARPQFHAYNRGKKSVALDLKDPSSVEKVRELTASAHVLVENFRPGTLSRFGLGYEDLRAMNPSLVYCSITGFGASGPYVGRPSYENVGLALSGMWSQLVDLGAPRPIGPNMADQLTALSAVQGILGALLHVARTGEGQLVEVSMLAATMAFLPQPITNFLAHGEVGQLDTRARRSQAYALLAGDGLPIAIHLSSVDKFWEGLLRVLGVPAWASDERFATLASRIEHYDDLEGLLQEAFRTRSRGEWLDRLNREDVPSAPINSISEALNDPQVQHLGMIWEYGEGDTQVSLVRCPVDYSLTVLERGAAAPELGQHTQDVVGGYER